MNQGQPFILALNLHQRVRYCLIQDEHQHGQDAIFLMMDISGNLLFILESIDSLYRILYMINILIQISLMCCFSDSILGRASSGFKRKGQRIFVFIVGGATRSEVLKLPGLKSITLS